MIHCLDKTADENLPTGVFESPEAADLSQPGSREVSQGDSISYGGCSVPMKTGSVCQLGWERSLVVHNQWNQKSGWDGVCAFCSKN